MKGKVHPRTGHEHPDGEYRYSFTRSLTSALAEGGGWSTPRPGRSTLAGQHGRVKSRPLTGFDSPAHGTVATQPALTRPGNVAAEMNDHDNISPQFLRCDKFINTLQHVVRCAETIEGGGRGGEPPLVSENENSLCR